MQLDDDRIWQIIVERNREIQHLETEMEQLSEISADLALMVQTQGEDIETAAENVVTAEITVTEATQHIENATIYHRKISRVFIGGLITAASVTVGGGLLTLLSPVVGVVTIGCGVVTGVIFIAAYAKKNNQKINF
jgi:t-SNARE complex subunit (syntaxin)